MKKIIALLILLILYGCGKTNNSKPDTTRNNIMQTEQPVKTPEIENGVIRCGDYTITGDTIVNASPDSTVIFSIVYPVISGLKDENRQSIVNSYLLKAATTNYSSLDKDADITNAGYATRLEAETKEMNAEYIGDAAFELTSCSNNFLSLYYSYVGYMTEAAYPQTETKCINIDIQSGDILTMSKIFKPGSDYKNFIFDWIKKDTSLGSDPSLPDNFNENDFYIKDNNITFVNLYTVHVLTGYEAVIPIADMRHMMTDEFLTLIGK